MDKTKEKNRLYTLVAIGQDGNEADAFGVIDEWVLTRIVRGHMGDCDFLMGGARYVTRHKIFAHAQSTAQKWIDEGVL